MKSHMYSNQVLHNNDIVLQHTTFIVTNTIAATCFGRTKQLSLGRMYQNM